MIIVVEGIDRVGKTTLCNKLKEELSIPIFKNERISEERTIATEMELTNQVINFFDCVNCNVILDRFFYSEFVYGLVDRGYYNNDILKFDTKLSNSNALFILIEPTDIVKSSTEHGKDLSLHKVLFDYCFDKSNIKNKIKANYNNLDDVVAWVKENVEVYKW